VRTYSSRTLLTIAMCPAACQCGMVWNVMYLSAFIVSFYVLLSGEELFKLLHISSNMGSLLSMLNSSIYIFPVY
jgi:hypothetical protein